ncbi:hypothetical protein BH23VER1_BH23VER1_18550 [soil metagenome]
MISFVIGAIPASYLYWTEQGLSDEGIAELFVSMLFLLAWAVFFIGFHRAMLEKGYSGEIALLGAIGPPSLIVFLLLPNKNLPNKNDIGLSSQQNDAEAYGGD